MTPAHYIFIYVASALAITVLAFGITTFLAVRQAVAEGDNLGEIELNIIPYIIGGIIWLPITAPALALFFVLEFACRTGASLATSKAGQ